MRSPYRDLRFVEVTPLEEAVLPPFFVAAELPYARNIITLKISRLPIGWDELLTSQNTGGANPKVMQRCFSG